MKFLHISDLHIGKKIYEFSLIEDQKYILDQILEIIDKEEPDAIFIAGDVFDKSIPSTEAVELLDEFMVSLADRRLEVFMIAGNHDSQERLAFGNRLMEKSGIHISSAYKGEISKFCLNDEFGCVEIFMLPFVKPASVRFYLEDEKIKTYTDAVLAALSKIETKEDSRKILLTHQFVTGAARTESEEISVGGTDNVDASVFEDFDYVALGHIHKAQNIESERIRYCGTPLKYSFSEARDEKTVTLGELSKDGELSITEIPLKPKREMVELKGTYDELTSRAFYQGKGYEDAYTHITLTDENDVPDAVSKLRIIYKNLMTLDYDNTRTRHKLAVLPKVEVENKSPLDLISEFYTLQNGSDLSEAQREIIEDTIEKIWGE